MSEEMSHEKRYTDNGELYNPFIYPWCVRCHKRWHWWMKWTKCGVAPVEGTQGGDEQ